MSDHSEILPLTESERLLFEQIVFRFETLRAAGEPVDIASILPPAEPLRGQVLRKLISLDLERDRQSGQQISVGDYITRYPELAGDDTFQALLRSLLQPQMDPSTRVGQSTSAGESTSTGKSTRPGTDSQPAIQFEWDAAATPESRSPGDPVWAAIQPGMVLGNYQILERIGRGGQGSVFKAQHQQMNRIVALKTLAPSTLNSPDAVKRFYREVETAARLDHPNIVSAYDAGEVDGFHILVMQYVDGHDLSSLVRTQGPLAVEQAVDFVLQAAEGLFYAHVRGVVHRDVKPGNLLVDSFRRVRVLDMGLARFSQTFPATIDPQADALTQTYCILGTVDFMAPEQAQDAKSADERSDIYSLGCTLFYLLTGQPPYRGDSAIARLMAHRETAVPRLSDLCRDVPYAVDECFRLMVAKQPGDRPQTMKEVISLLQAALKRPVTVPTTAVQAATVSSATSPLPASRPVAKPGPVSSDGPVFRVLNADIDKVSADVLLLKHAQGFYGVDAHVRNQLEDVGQLDTTDFRLPVGNYRLIETTGFLWRRVCFLGVPSLEAFGYREMRKFAYRAIEILSQEQIRLRRLVTTTHGAGIGLDAVESMAHLLDGFREGLQAFPIPGLNEVIFVEHEDLLAVRLTAAMQALNSEYELQQKWHTGSRKLLVAFPAGDEFEDLYQFGILQPAQMCEFQCERISFHPREPISLSNLLESREEACILVADVSSADPRTWLEIGLALGRGQQTILLARQGTDLQITAPGMLVYRNIRQLARDLEQRLKAISAE